MPTKKKRASFSKSPHIAAQAVVTSLEDDHGVEEKIQSEIPPTASIPPVNMSENHGEKKEISESEISEVALEEMLANDAQESTLSTKNVWLYRVGTVVTGAIVVCAVLLYGAYMRQYSAPKVPVVSTNTPTLVPTVVVDTKSITIEVFNGSGVSGKAQKTADELKGKGYTVVSTGNAKKIPISEVSISPSLSEQAKTMLLHDLQSFGISSISANPLVSSISARVILGLK